MRGGVLGFELGDLRGQQFHLAVLLLDLGLQPRVVVLQLAELARLLALAAAGLVAQALMLLDRRAELVPDLLVGVLLAGEQRLHLPDLAVRALEVVEVGDVLVLGGDRGTFSCSQTFWSSPMRRSSFWLLLKRFLSSSHSWAFWRAMLPTFSFSWLWA